MAGSYVVGDQTHIVSDVVEKVRYHNISAEDGSPRDYRNWRTSIEINDKGRAELYLGNDTISRLVRENGMVGTFGEEVDEFMEEKTGGLKDWFEGVREKYLK